MLRPLALLFLLIASISAFGNQGSARLSFFPTIAVADNRTQINVTCEVRTTSGGLVPDGTRVSFTTNLGTFFESVVETRAGIARAVLTAPALPGLAKVTASVPSLATNVTLEYEFVKDRAELSKLQEYIEVNSDQRLLYAMGDRIMLASSPNGKAKISFRSVEITGADLQLNVPTYEVRGRNVVLKTFGKEFKFDQLNYSLNRRTGFGLTTVERERKMWRGPFPGGEIVTEIRPVKAVVKIDGGELVDTRDGFSPNSLDMADVVGLSVDVRATHATVWPAREIYFQNADVTIEGKRVIQLKLMRTSTQENAPILGEQLINVSNSNVSLQYPYYLTLKPNSRSLLRVRSGIKSSTGAGATGGNFLDFESRWNKAGVSDGNFTLRGIARNDWSVGVQQFNRLNDTTTMYFQADSPSHSSVFSSLQLARQFSKANLNYNASLSRSLRGTKFASIFHTIALENNPIQLGKSPFNLTYGLTAQHSDGRSGGQSRSSTNAGVRARLNSQYIPIGGGRSISTSAQVTHRVARNSSQGTAVQGSVIFSQYLNATNLSLSYDYIDDKINSFSSGKHRLSTEASYYKGPIEFRFYGGKSLDANRYNWSSSLGYRFSPLWRVSALTTEDRFDSIRFTETSFILGYNLGVQEVGLSWSSRTKRIGLELFGVSL